MTLINSSSLDTSPPDWAVDGVIPRTGIGILHGPSYTGKSLVTNGELALAVANGCRFFGHQAVQGCAAICLGEGLYDAGIRKQARLARQARDNAAKALEVAQEDGEAAAAAFLAALPPYTDERLYVLTEPFVVPVTRDGKPTLSMEQAITELQLLPDLELVILDALSDFNGGLSISNDASANRYMLGLKHMLQQLNCAVLAVHHQTADGKKMLGAERLFSASDFVIEVRPQEPGQAGEPKGATLSCKKSKYGPEFKPMAYTIEEVEWDEPVRDDDGQLTGETVKVSTATVRAAGSGTTGLRMPGALPAPPPLPAVRDVPRPRKRNGLRVVGQAMSGDMGPPRPATRWPTSSVADHEREMEAR